MEKHLQWKNDENSPSQNKNHLAYSNSMKNVFYPTSFQKIPAMSFIYIVAIKECIVSIYVYRFELNF